MAILKDIYDRCLEIKFLSFENGYIKYGFKFFSDEGSFFNPLMLKSEYFECYEYGGDNLIPFFEKTLNTNDELLEWGSLEPDICINVKHEDDSIDMSVLLNVAEFKPISRRIYGEFGIAISFFVNKGTLSQFIDDLKKEIEKMGK